MRAGDIYAKELSRCEEARRHYESAVRGFEEQAACVEQAKAGLLSCPDYFPTDAGRTWVYGDSASKGKNMRLEWELRLSKDGKREIVGGLFAGNKKISDQNAKYAKEGWAVWEETAGGKTVILRYPYQTGQSWEGRSGGHPVEFSVEDDAARVETAAGLHRLPQGQGARPPVSQDLEDHLLRSGWAHQDQHRGRGSRIPIRNC